MLSRYDLGFKMVHFWLKLPKQFFMQTIAQFTEILYKQVSIKFFNEDLVFGVYSVINHLLKHLTVFLTQVQQMVILQTLDLDAFC